MVEMALACVYWTPCIQPIYEAGSYWNNGRWA